MPRLAGASCLLAAASAAPADPVCGRSWRKVLRWQKGLEAVEDFGRDADEVLLREEVPALQLPRVNVLQDGDYQHLRMKVRRPGRLRQPRLAAGARERLLLELRDGWLFPSGFAANATHFFHLRALRESNCVQSHLARLVGRARCAGTDWSRMLVYRSADQVQDARDTSWLTEGMPDYRFRCESLGSVISLIDTQFGDYGHFHESVLPRLLWPEVQALRDSVVVWRHKPEGEGYVQPWLDLLGLSRRSFQSVRRQDVAFRFDRLYLPLVVGLDEAFADRAEITAHTPAVDLVRLRAATLGALPARGSAASTARGCVILCERDPAGRRALGGADAVRLRRASRELARAAGLDLLSLRGRPGGFEVAEVSARGEAGPWRSLPLADGLGAFTRARVVLGVHGSLLMHIFLAPPGAHVVDVQALHTYDMPLYHISAVLGLSYWYHPVEGMHSSRTLPLAADRLERLLARVSAQLTAETQTEAAAGEL